MIKYIMLIYFMRKFKREREAIGLQLRYENLVTMPDKKANNYTKLLEEIDKKIEATCLLFKS